MKWLDRDIPSPVLETERLILRQARIEDAQAMFDNWASDPEVTRHLTWSYYTDPAECAEYISELIEEDAWDWFIEFKETGEPIGSFGIFDLHEPTQSVECGYVIGRPWWNKGIVTEALEAVMEWLFDYVGVQVVRAKHSVDNPASGRVMVKCGMQFEGFRRHGGRNGDGTICDLACYSILADEWDMLHRERKSR